MSNCTSNRTSKLLCLGKQGVQLPHAKSFLMLKPALGFVAPYTLEGKKLLQKLCEDIIGWDTKVTGNIVQEWKIWCENLMKLENCMIKRCYKPKGFGKIKEFWIHNFSDASEEGYT